MSSDELFPEVNEADQVYIDPGQEALPGLEEWTHQAVVERESGARAAPQVPSRVVARAAVRSKGRAKGKQSSRGFQMLEFFLVGIAVVVGILIFAVAILLMRPSGSSSLFADLNQNLKATLGPSYDTALGAIGGTFGRARDGYDARVRPITRKVGGYFGIEYDDGARKVPITSAEIKLFAKCAECHDLYQYRSALSGIYIDHDLHGNPWQKTTGGGEHDKKKEEGKAEAEEEVEEEEPENPEVLQITCVDCHRDAGIHVQDPKDTESVAVTEASCYTCHKEWDQRGTKQASVGTCRKCHAPGWYFDKAFISKEKTDRFIANREIHKRKLDTTTFSYPSLTGPKRRFCMNCHRRFDFCNDCHQVMKGSHRNKAQFISTHGEKLIVTKEWAMTDCWACHNGSWCVRKCHINGTKSEGVPRSRSLGKYPIPWKSLKYD